MSRPGRGRAGRAGQVRLIGGRWRGTLLEVLDAPGLRPSPDRLRETLFNWLAPVLPGAHCLDLFAGSGALGLEAASRGAAEVLCVERDARAADALRASVTRLGAEDAVRVLVGDWRAALDGAAAPTAGWDVVFVDPPFDAGLQAPVLAALGPALAPEARVHLESAVRDAIEVPPALEVLRDKRFGDVRARLLAPVRDPDHAVAGSGLHASHD